MVKMEKGEAGDAAYRISANLVHGVLLSLVGIAATGILSMGVWIVTDASWKSSMGERITNHAIRLEAIERDAAGGVLPVTKERIDQLERRVRYLEERAYGAQQR